MTGIFLMATQKFLNLPQKFFVFFSTANLFFLRRQAFSKKKNFLHAKFDFLSALRSPGYTHVGIFFPFRYTIFSKALKIYISFVWRVYVCLAQCLIIVKFKF